MAWTQEDLNAIDQLIATGSKKIQYGDKIMEARPLDEMLKIKNMMQKELGLPTGAGKVIVSASKGL